MTTSSSRPLAKARQKQNREKMARWALQTVARAVVPVFCKPEIQGNPLTKNALWAGNHVGHTDPLIMLWAASKSGAKPQLIGSENFFKIPAIGWLMRQAKYSSVTFTESNSHKVDTGKTDIRFLIKNGATEIAHGGVIAGYPSKRITRRKDLVPERLSTGFARMALATGASIQPVTTLGAQNVIPFDKKDMLHAGAHVIGNLVTGKRPKTIIYFGDPIKISEAIDPPAGEARRVTEHLEARLIEDHTKVVERNPGINRVTDPSRPTDSPAQERKPRWIRQH